jgi:hypothetical protein
MSTFIAPPLDTLPRPQADRQPPPSTAFNVPIGRLRAFLVALVVAHHAVLAYNPWAPPPNTSLMTQPRFWQAFPTVDPDRCVGWAVFNGFNDIFFMALLFFVSGLFVWDSLRRKGAAQFLRDRFLRLGSGFLIIAALTPLAYYPAYLQAAAQPSLADFCQQWRALGAWPAGPAWFLWVLLAFASGAAALHALAPRWVETLNQRASSILRRPFLCMIALTVLSSLAYVPLTMLFSPLDWKSWGPFAFQTTRPLLYALYFAAGVVVGVGGAGQPFLSPSGPLARRWILSPARAILAFAIASVLGIMVASKPIHPRLLDIAANTAFTLSCAASSFACLSLFLRFARNRHPLLDDLCACSFGIYLVHYPIVNWLQRAFLASTLSAFLKGLCVSIGAIALSWLLVTVLRRSRGLARII